MTCGQSKMKYWMELWKLAELFLLYMKSCSFVCLWSKRLMFHRWSLLILQTSRSWRRGFGFVDRVKNKQTISKNARLFVWFSCWPEVGLTVALLALWGTVVGSRLRRLHRAHSLEYGCPFGTHGLFHVVEFGVWPSSALLLTGAHAAAFDVGHRFWLGRAGRDAMGKVSTFVCFVSVLLLSVEQSLCRPGPLRSFFKTREADSGPVYTSVNSPRDLRLHDSSGNW